MLHLIDVQQRLAVPFIGGAVPDRCSTRLDPRTGASSARKRSCVPPTKSSHCQAPPLPRSRRNRPAVVDVVRSVWGCPAKTISGFRGSGHSSRLGSDQVAVVCLFVCLFCVFFSCDLTCARCLVLSTWYGSLCQCRKTLTRPDP